MNKLNEFAFPPTSLISNKNPRKDRQGSWLDDVKDAARKEPWGENDSILIAYIKTNFEIAKSQNKVYEGDAFAIWRVGTLVTELGDPIWLKYTPNSRKAADSKAQPWYYDSIKIGHEPELGILSEKYSVRYEPEEFNVHWDIHIEPRTIEHILTHNGDRLSSVFNNANENTPHRIFRVVYGEVMLQKRHEAEVLPQWYNEDYGFLMPLRLTSPEKVDLVAALSIERVMKRYKLHTLLPVSYAYAAARSVAKSRVQFTSWLADEDLEKAEFDDDVINPSN